MKRFCLILAAGSATRLRAGKNKVYLHLKGKRPLEYTLAAFKSAGCFQGALVVYKEGELEEAKMSAAASGFQNVFFAAGGATRQESAYKGLLALPPDTDIVAVHDGARCFTDPELIRNCVKSCEKFGSGVAGRMSTDTVKRTDREGRFLETLDRREIAFVQTPQVFRYQELLSAYQKAVEEGFSATDDAGIMEYAGYAPRLVESQGENLKLTYREDFYKGERLLGGSDRIYIGQGFDIHPFAEGRRLILGGVEIEHDKGLLGHSDADVLCHAVTDALLGASGLSDIGELFPDTDDKWKDANSLELLAQVVERILKRGYQVINVDATVFLEKPRLSPYKKTMEEKLSAVLQTDHVNVKAKTMEGFGAVGGGQAAAASAICSIRRRDAVIFA